MQQETITKPAAIRSLRIWSIIVCCFYGLSTLHSLNYTFSWFSSLDLLQPEHEPIPPLSCVTNIPTITYGLMAIPMFLLALLFLQLARNGQPFRQINVKRVRILAVIFFAVAVIPSLGFALYMLIAGDEPLIILVYGIGCIDTTQIVKGLLMLFIAQILHYGTMLQLESDETL